MSDSVQPVDTQLTAGFSTRWVAPYFKSFTRPSGNMVTDAIEGGSGIITGTAPAGHGEATLRAWAGLPPDGSSSSSSDPSSSSARDGNGGGVLSGIASTLTGGIADQFSSLGKAIVWIVVGLLVLAVGLLMMTKGN